MCLVTQNTDKLLQMLNREHPVGLYHSLVRQLHLPQSQGSPEGGAVCITQTTCHPGHLQHPMSQEGQKEHQGQPPKPLPVHPAIIQKARSVQVHQSCIKNRCIKNSFYLKAIRLLNHSTERLLPTYTDLIIGH